MRGEKMPVKSYSTGVKSPDWFYLIDALRGTALLNMLLFHFGYDYFIIFARQPGWYSMPAVHIWQRFICITFLFVSGISYHFGHSNLKKGILLNLYGCCITIVTLLFIPSEAVWFGILNCIGCCTLLLWLLEKAGNVIALKKHRGCRHSVFFALCGFFLFLLFFIITFSVPDGKIVIPFLAQRKLPSSLYHVLPLTILGFPIPGFSSSDYFPLIPWFFLFLCGYFFWKLVLLFPAFTGIFRLRIPILSKLGRYSLIIYLLHQPILYLATALIVNISKL